MLFCFFMTCVHVVIAIAAAAAADVLITRDGSDMPTFFIGADHSRRVMSRRKEFMFVPPNATPTTFGLA